MHAAFSFFSSPCALLEMALLCHALPRPSLSRCAPGRAAAWPREVQRRGGGGQGLHRVRRLQVRVLADRRQAAAGECFEGLGTSKCGCLAAVFRMGAGEVVCWQLARSPFRRFRCVCPRRADAYDARLYRQNWLWRNPLPALLAFSLQPASALPNVIYGDEGAPGGDVPGPGAYAVRDPWRDEAASKAQVRPLGRGEGVGLCCCCARWLPVGALLPRSECGCNISRPRFIVGSVDAAWTPGCSRGLDSCRSVAGQGVAGENVPRAAASHRADAFPKRLMEHAVPLAPLVKQTNPPPSSSTGGCGICPITHGRAVGPDSRTRRLRCAGACHRLVPDAFCSWTEHLAQPPPF